MQWQLNILGVRGSAPTAGRNYTEYGGSTSCVYLDCGEQVIFDAGTGIGTDFVVDPSRPVHILLSHMHLDHIQGLPGFRLLGSCDSEIHIYSESRSGLDTETQLAQVFSPPCWPLRLRDYGAKIVFHDIQPGKDFSIGSCRVHPLRLSHPDQCTGYSIADGSTRFAYLLDCAYGSTAPEELECLRGCTAAVMDGFFSPGAERPDWGHSSWRQCTDLAQSLAIPKPIITHYSPCCTDQILRNWEQRADGRCIFAREGMTITL